MQRKSGTKVGEAIQTREITEALATTRTLSSEEEKALRMRHGAKVAPATRLDRHGEGNEELQDELLLMEMQLVKAYREYRLRQSQERGRATATVRPSRTKDKIVRELRRKR